jgi:Big-like domain-containing protein
MNGLRRYSRLLCVVMLAVVAATCRSLTDANGAARSFTVVLATVAQQASGAVAPPFVSVVDSVHLVVTSPSGATLFTGGQRLQRNQMSVSLPVELSVDAATFKAQILSSNRTVLFEGDTSVTFAPNDFTIVVPVPARRPVLVATPDTARAVFDSAMTRGALAIHNRGSGSLVWSVVVDPAFAQCGQACRITPSSGTIPAGKSDTLRISISSVPPFARVFSFVLRSSEGDVSVQWQLSPSPVVSVAVSSTDVLLFLRQSQQLASTVQVNGTVSKAVFWSTSNRNVVNLSANGLATGVSPGLATVTATSAVDSSKKGTALVRVFDPAQKFPFSWTVTEPAQLVTVRRDDQAPGLHSVTLRAAGVAQTVPFPMATINRTEFWVQLTGFEWFLVGQTSSAAPDTTGRGWTFSTTWNPQGSDGRFPNPSSNRLNLVALAISTAGVVYATPFNTNITVTVP